MKSERRIAFLVFLCLVLTSNVRAAERNYSLILAEFGEDSGGEQTQTLVRYHFKGGVMVRKENILTTKTSELRYDLGKNRIYHDRYVITEWGDVVDLTARKMLFKSKGELVDVDERSDSVIVRVDRDNDSGIYVFDLASHRSRRMHRPGLWAAPGTLSPNRQLRASGQGSEIRVRRSDGKNVLLGRDFSREGTPMCSSMSTPTFLWSDEMHLVTQRGNGHLVIVDVEGKVESLAIIPDVDAPLCGPELQRDEDNQIYYEAGRKAWRIDVAKHTFEPYLWEGSGHGFDVEFQQNASYGRVLRYEGTEIGRFWCDSTSTAPGHIAVEFGAVGSNLGYPDGVKAWSAESHEWTTIKADLAAVVGWTAD